MTWTFTITGPDGQAGSTVAEERTEVLAAALNLINDCLDMPVPPPSKGEPQERKKARG